jgi:hypothetical protein
MFDLGKNDLFFAEMPLYLDLAPISEQL